MTDAIEVFADVSCPFAYVGLTKLVAEREARGLTAPRLRVRAWPLEIVNGTALTGPALVPKVAALRRRVARDRFRGFDPQRFPRSTLPALAAEAAANRVDVATGEAFSLAVRLALFEEGLDVGDGDVVEALRARYGIPPHVSDDDRLVLDDLADGRSRDVIGSPHFFTPRGDFFCPTLVIRRIDDRFDVTFDEARFQELVAAVFA